MKTIRVQDYGASLRVRLSDTSGSLIDLSSSAARQFYIKRPDGTILIVTATLYTNGTDGVLAYTTVSGDINQTGIYELEARVTFSGSEFRSSKIRFRVAEIIS